MVLVDTSIIIGYFKGIISDPYTTFDELLESNTPLGIEKRRVKKHDRYLQPRI
ncbi:hypothetical protein AGMMS50212_16540 [Spirochaetia bacterium]|nr:hypothetical protein AGMMS50212_16540 [Spirochaetia bacterium]